MTQPPAQHHDRRLPGDFEPSTYLKSRTTENGIYLLYIDPSLLLQITELDPGLVINLRCYFARINYGYYSVPRTRSYL